MSYDPTKRQLCSEVSTQALKPRMCRSWSAVKFTYTNSTVPTDTSVQSDNYPGVYPVNSNVTWVWETGQGRWGVYFRDFHLSPDEDFTDGGDWLGIESDREVSVRTYTYSSQVEPYVSKGSKLIVNFVSDGTKDEPTVRGFNLEIYYGNSEREVRLKLHEAANKKPKDEDGEGPSTIVILTIVFTILTAVLVAIICGLKLTRAKKAKSNDDRDVFGVRRESGIRHSRQGSSTSPPQSPVREGAPGQQTVRQAQRQATNLGWMARAELNNSLNTARRDQNLETNGHATQAVEQGHHGHHHYSNNTGQQGPPDSDVAQHVPRIMDGASAPSSGTFKEMRQVFDCVSDRVGQCRDTSHSFRFHGDQGKNTGHAPDCHVAQQVPQRRDGSAAPFKEMRQVFECVSNKVGQCRDTSHSFRFLHDLDTKSLRCEDGRKTFGNASAEKHANTYTVANKGRKSEDTQKKQNFHSGTDDEPEEEGSGSGPPSYESLLQDNAASASTCAEIGCYDNLLDMQSNSNDDWPGQPTYGIYMNAPPTESLESVSDLSSSSGCGVENEQQDGLSGTLGGPTPCPTDDTAIYSLALPVLSITEHPPSPVASYREPRTLPTCSSDINQTDSSHLRFVDGYAYIVTQPEQQGDLPATATTQSRAPSGDKDEFFRRRDAVPGSLISPPPASDMAYIEMSIVRNSPSARSENIYTNELTRLPGTDLTSER
ncbi:hypothetical protein Btru_053743 [Bulinus truncatus]|nr:hypothetical protein Btru_053743 [Bulinus truncatus]